MNFGGVSVATEIWTWNGSGVGEMASASVSLHWSCAVPATTTQDTLDETGTTKRSMLSNDDVIAVPSSTPADPAPGRGLAAPPPPSQAPPLSTV